MLRPCHVLALRAVGRRGREVGREGGEGGGDGCIVALVQITS